MTISSNLQENFMGLIYKLYGKTIRLNAIFLFYCLFMTVIYLPCFLIRQVVGEHHPKYAECLADYGFYLLNIDAVAASVNAYQVSY